MGGGDLNTKKTWHPSTLKNQERVWKAEQAAAEEKKRIAELERERAQERDREQLNALAKKHPHSSEPTDNRLHWMYDKPDKKAQQEDYLLGKAIDKNYDQVGKSDQNEIPAVSRRVVGSSMITSAGDVQVDLARKLREDPLLLVKERERAARAALLNNPVQRRRLTELLRKEQEQKNSNKEEKKSKKKDKSIDNLLAAKLNALGGEKGMNIAKLLESGDSSSDSSSDEEVKKKKKKKKKKKQKSKNRDGESDDELPHKSKKASKRKSNKSSDDSDKESETKASKYQNSSRYETSKKSSSTKRKSENVSSDDEGRSYKRNRRNYSPKRNMETDKQKVTRDSGYDRKNIEKDKHKYDEHRYDEDRERRIVASDRRDKQGSKRTGLSEEEKAARLAAMVAAGAEREVQRGRRVAEQRAENAAAEKSITRHSSRNEARVLPDSLESRIHSNRHYIQRDQRHMNEHFARR